MSKKNHVDGSHVRGDHGTVTDDVGVLLQRLERTDWFRSVRVGPIEQVGKGGKKVVAVKTPHATDVHQNTLTLSIRAHGSVQKLFVEVVGLNDAERKQQILEELRSAVRKKIRGADFFVTDRMTAAE